MSNMYHFTIGKTPHDIINLQLEKLCPEGYYHFYRLNSTDYSCLCEATNKKNLDEYTETGNIIYIPTKDMTNILSNLYELHGMYDEYEDYLSLRSAILETLEIEEV